MRLLKGNNNTTASPVSEVAKHAEVIALAVPWSAVPNIVSEIGAELRGKVLIDCTNPAKQRLTMDHSAGSGGEQVAQLLPGTKVVKAFNTTGFETMQTPRKRYTHSQESWDLIQSMRAACRSPTRWKLLPRCGGHWPTDRKWAVALLSG